MKLRKIFYSTTTAILIIAGVSSCSKETLNVNQNPNQPTDSTIAYNAILPAALNNTARAVATNWGWLQNWLGYWARSGTYAPSTTEESYNVTTNFKEEFGILCMIITTIIKLCKYKLQKMELIFMLVLHVL